MKKNTEKHKDKREIAPLGRFSITTIRGVHKLVEDDSKGDLYYVDPNRQEFATFPQPKKPATDLNPRPFATIITEHEYLAPAIFRPTILEVQEQIPKKYAERCAAFESFPKWFARREGFHTGVTHLYEKRTEK